ncbi:MAG: septum formation protein Maf [Bacteroidales bacterium]|mgnify:FL=1|jgi:septum formation protein|nr:septum formation protein Maf [Bacteroidales bacterium]
MKRIILGSNSPRRRELLAGLDVDFTVDTGNSFEEIPEEGLEAHEVPCRLSAGKSHGFHRPLEADEVLITSDTVVIVDGEVLGKPHSRGEAVAMLRKLSGRSHEVVTAVTLRDSVREETFSVSTKVHFVELTQAEIDHYVDKYKPLDKAGAYGIQEWIGFVGISSIEGSFYNVMGFPVHRVWHELQSFL